MIRLISCCKVVIWWTNEISVFLKILDMLNILLIVARLMLLINSKQIPKIIKWRFFYLFFFFWQNFLSDSQPVRFFVVVVVFFAIFFWNLRNQFLLFSYVFWRNPFVLPPMLLKTLFYPEKYTSFQENTWSDNALQIFQDFSSLPHILRSSPLRIFLGF